MKRRQLLFVSVVFTALVTGFILEQQRDDEAWQSLSHTQLDTVDLPPVELPLELSSLRGWIVDERGHGLAGVAVHLIRELGQARATEPLPWARTGEDGSFRIDGVPSGAFTAVLLGPGRETRRVAVQSPRSESVRWEAGARAEPPEPLPEMVLRDLRGNLARPVGSADGEASLAGYEVWLEPRDEADWLGGVVPRRTTVGADGSFAFDRLVTGGYLARVLPPWAAGGTWPVLTDETLQHVTGDPGGAARVDLRLRSGSVDGRLTDDTGDPLAGALVRIWPKDRPDRSWPAESTDADGAFRIPDLPAGTYVVRIRAGAAEHEGEVDVRVGVRTTHRPPSLAPRDG